MRAHHRHVEAQKKLYRLTSEGRSLWGRRRKLRLPSDYRRILGMVEFSGHPEVIRSYLPMHSAGLVDQWLVEFEALRLIEAVPGAQVELAAIARKAAPPPPEVDDARVSAPEVSYADTSLSRLGVYAAHERIAGRPASGKRAEDTVALVVEDDPDQLALAVRRLESSGYQVRTADCVQALLSALRESVPDALFLDVNLPDGDGFDVLGALRRHPAYTHLPIVMLTARTKPAEISRGLALGADGYITKPYGSSALEYLLRYVLKQEIDKSPARGTRSAREMPA